MDHTDGPDAAKEVEDFARAVEGDVAGRVARESADHEGDQLTEEELATRTDRQEKIPAGIFPAPKFLRSIAKALF